MLTAGYSIGLNRNGEMKGQLLHAGSVYSMNFFAQQRPGGVRQFFFGSIVHGICSTETMIDQNENSGRERSVREGIFTELRPTAGPVCPPGKLLEIAG